MPKKPLKPCKHPGCPKLIEGNYCEEHKKLYVSERGSASSRGYNSKWRTVRNGFLKASSLCVKCKEQGKLTKTMTEDRDQEYKYNF